jgi:hypothetical protein
LNFDSGHYRTASWVGIALLAVATAVVIFRGDWTGVALLAAFLVASIAFLVFEDNLPTLFDALFVSAAIINAAGWVWNLYTRVWGYDEFAHFYTTFAATLSLGYLTFFVMRKYFRQHPGHFLVVVTSFGVTLGAWWEVVEWIILKKLTDPVGDIVVDSIGAVLAAFLALWVLRKTTPAQKSSST